MLIFWTGSGDLATWAQAVGTVAAFWAVAIGLRRERKNRLGEDLRHVEGVAAAFLTAAGNFMVVMNGRRTLVKQPRLFRLGEAREVLTVAESVAVPLMRTSIEMSLLGYDDLTTAAGKITDLVAKIGPAFTGSKKKWQQVSEEYDQLLGEFRTALDAVRSSIRVKAGPPGSLLARPGPRARRQ